MIYISPLFQSMIFLQSNSAYIDVYVTTLFCFLAILRLIGVLKGITYYKCLRQLTDKSSLNQKQQLDMEQQQATKGHNWPNFFAGAATFLPGNNHLISSSASPSASRPLVSMPDNAAYDISSHPAGYRALNTQQMHAFRTHSNGQQQQGGGSMPTSKLLLNTSSTMLDETQMMMMKSPKYHSTTLKPTRHAARDTPQLLILPETKHHHQQSTVRVESSSRSKSRSRQHNFNNNSSSSNVFMVNGRAHRIIPSVNEDSGRHSEPVAHIQMKSTAREERDMNNNEQELQLERQQELEFNESLPAGLSFRKINDDDFEVPENSANSVFANSEQNLLDEVMQVAKAKATKRRDGTLPNAVRSNGTTYTLLSAAQLDKISRKLAKSNGRNTITHIQSTNNNNNKYRLVNATTLNSNQAPSSSSGKRDSGLAHDLSSTSSLSSSSSGPDIESDVSLPTTNSRRQLERKHARLLGIRQTEEQLVEANSIKTGSNKHNTLAKLSSSQDMSYFPGKCKF